MFRMIAQALLLAITLCTTALAAPDQVLTGRMMLNSGELGTMVLKTSSGLVALGHSADMKITGAPNQDALKVCDELTVDAVAKGPALAIRTVTVKGSGKAEECPLPTVPVVPAAVMYKGLADKSALVVDVRTPAEFAKARFDGAVNIPLTELAGRLQEFQTDRPIIIYCATARRSAFAAAILQEKGIKSSIVKGRFVVKDGKPRIDE